MNVWSQSMSQWYGIAIRIFVAAGGAFLGFSLI